MTPPPSYPKNGSCYHVHIKSKLLKIYTSCVRLDSYWIHNVGSTHFTYDFCPQLNPDIHTIQKKKQWDIWESYGTVSRDMKDGETVGWSDM